MAKLKIFAYLCIGFVLSLVTSKMMSASQALIVIASLPFVGLLHELMHLIAINAVGAQHRFVFKGLYTGFSVSVEKIEDFIFIALAPQAISLLLVLLYLSTYSTISLALMVIHIAISAEDIHKAIRYAKQILLH